MKYILTWILLFVFSQIVADGQRIQTVDTGKYRINLPDYWRPGNKVWKILTDKLPLICEELKDKELCGDDCNPYYRIELEMSDPFVIDYFPNHVASVYTHNEFRKPSDTWDIQTRYAFESSLLLRNEKGILLTRLILVDTNETWLLSHRITLASYSPPPIPATYYRRVRTSRYSGLDPNIPVQPPIPDLGQEGETPYSYINRNREKLMPSYRDLFVIIDRKINSW